MVSVEAKLKAAYSIGEYAKLTGQSRESVKSQARRGTLTLSQAGPGSRRYIMLNSIGLEAFAKSMSRRDRADENDESSE
ncbi:MAG: hypothetical protein U0165_03535 [Polyangiaceae bacterium]